MKVIIKKNKKTLVKQLELANNPFKRLKGLLFTKNLPRGMGMMLTPCNSVHTLGMAYSIDVLFVNKKNIVTKLIHHMKPNRLSPIELKAYSVIEVPADTLKECDVTIGDELELNQF